MTYLTLILEVVEKGLGVVGAAVILWGVLATLVEFLLLELKKLRGTNICTLRENLRQHLGSYILLGLEILIAADIIRTLIKPSAQELITLGVIVTIRTVLDFFLSRSMRSHDCSGGAHG
ncbi:MAG: DUF1622 domain-containing protein [Chrysiogenales bacterium]|nr:MAG: DUF1622 domain-containing protein [Chrysiogenales bacterium]